MQVHFKKIIISILILLLTLSLVGCNKSNDKITWNKWLNIVSIECGYSDDESSALIDLDSFGLIDINAYHKDLEITKDMIEFTVNSLISNTSQAKEVITLMNINKFNEPSIYEYIKHIKEALNNPVIDQKSSSIKELDYINNEDNRFYTEDEYESDDIIIHDDELYVIDSIDGNWIELIPFSESDSLDIFEELDIDFNDVEVEMGGYYVVPPSAGIINNQVKKHRIGNYEVSYNYSTSSIHFNIENVAENSLPIFFQFNINNIKPIIKINRKGLDIESAFFKVKFSSIIQAGIKKSAQEERLFDFSSIGSNTLEEYFKKNGLAVTDSLHIATLKIPVSNIPTCTINIKVYLNFFANGKIEVSLFENQEVGFEYINGKIRTIKDSDKELSLLAQSKGSVKSNIELSTNLMNVNIMDVFTEFGIEAEASATLTPHTDTLVLLCTDLLAYWIWDIGVNSKNSVLGKLNLTKTINLVNKENGSLFSSAKHIENFMIVEKCTRNKMNIDRDDLQLTERIRLAKYLYIISLSDTQKINITALPSGYMLDDISIKVINNDIVSVDGLLITPLNSGITNILVFTNDNKYSVELTVIVK